ncbi:hypothetical protein MCOR27_001460 [Pyricularia oryzae]|uniref:DUF221-domain-containing protein n=1 Tax=Pyricularia grisea TaxID=148305 RepID=A0ABQ8NWP0_PYRGI|nr:hypothetical protein MCOR01_010359 [Pyricularia oryzae]KAI6303205.1 hypothetical protein MCOR33_001650 [Pyricularia grisea]KAI6265668.1 hypothetical protein MCOR26_010619 [Pyricularia oryzae]KAI6287285.1 hypothetical protein MCOR27_001460 [Pyricularia oryzae]KAI6313952.1 hypothetical protein MCOR30_010081 [Pyricularia oryzae]
MSSQEDQEKLTENKSLSGLYSTLVPVLIASGAYLAIFLILRRSQRRWYAPRTYIGSLRPGERTPELPNGLFNWFGQFWKIPDTYALQHQGLDAYLYLRYMRMSIVITFVGCCITWPILFPVNITGGGGQEQLDMLSYANVNAGSQEGRYRFFAHAITAWIFYGFILYLIFRELVFYINLRQAFLLSPLYSRRISSRTVLFTSVPDAYLDEAHLRQVFGPSVRNVWITYESKEVDELVKKRDERAYRLEKAEVKLIKLADKNRRAALKKGGSDAEADASKNEANQLDTESGSIAARWVPQGKRPTHRTGALGLIGSKVDSIDYCRDELHRLIPKTHEAQRQYRSGTSKKIPGVFVEFRSQGEAEAAYQVVAHHRGLQMAPRYIGITPGDVIWSSLKVSWWQRVVRRYLVLAFIAALIIFWAFPVLVVGIITNIDKLKQDVSWLSWLNYIPDAIMGVITGLLPSVALAILMSLVPIIMRLCAKLSGEPSHSRCELFTQNAYFCFQIVQVFFVTTVGSAGTELGPQLQKMALDPQLIPQTLADTLPKPGNFYNNYFLVQGLTIAASVLSQIVGFVIFQLMYRFLASTPRALYQKWATLSAISWGSTLPVYTMITCIAIIYAVITPLVLGFACLAMCLFYIAWRYNVLFVTDTKIDTRGLIYPRALKQLFVGVYVAEICMIGLFGASTAIGPAVLMAALLLFTVLFQLTLTNALDPLLYNLPQTLLAEEELLLLAPQNGALSAGPSGATGTTMAMNGFASNDAHSPADIKDTEAAAIATVPSAKKGNILSRFFMPWMYADYATLRKLVPQGTELDLDLDNLYSDEVNGNAYYPPAVTSTPPLLWIPRDAAGVSKQEIAHTGKVIHITDEGCELDENGKLVWDRESTRPPVWEEKVPY